MFGPQGILQGPVSQIGRAGGREIVASGSSNIDFDGTQWEDYSTTIALAETLPGSLDQYWLEWFHWFKMRDSSGNSCHQNCSLSLDALDEITVNFKVLTNGRNGTAHWKIFKMKQGAVQRIRHLYQPTGTGADTIDITLSTALIDYTKCSFSITTQGNENINSERTTNQDTVGITGGDFTSNSNLQLISYVDDASQDYYINVQIYDPKG